MVPAVSEHELSAARAALALRFFAMSRPVALGVHPVLLHLAHVYSCALSTACSCASRRMLAAPLLISGALGMASGLGGAVSPLSGSGALFLALREFGMGVWLIVEGIKRDAVARLAAPRGHAAAELA